MTVGTPSWIAASAGAPAYDATELRLIDTVDLMWDGHNLGARAGVRPGGNPLAVTLSGSPLTWTVQPGIAVISGISLGALGAYRVPVLAAVSGTMPAADATFTRRDIVVLRVRDPEADGGALREGAIDYITGLPASTPSAPATPANSLLLATITVPRVGDPTQPSVALSTVYTVAAGGVLPTSARPSNAYPGQMIYRLDTGHRETWNGSAWLSESILRPAARLTQTSAQSFTHATFSELTFQSATFNAGGMADLANSRLIAPRTGIYTVSGRVAFAGNSAGYRRVDLRINGAVYAVGETKDANTAFSVATTVSFTEHVFLAANDAIKLHAIQTSGGSLATVASTDYYSMLSAVFETAAS